MELITSVEATALGTAVTGAIGDNIAGILAILGIAVGLSVAFGLLRYGVAKLGSSWK